MTSGSPSTSTAGPTSRRSRCTTSTASPPWRSPRRWMPGPASCAAGDHTSYKRTSSLVKIAPAWALRPVMAAAGVVAGGFGKGFVGQPASRSARRSSPTSAPSGSTRPSSHRCRWPARRSTSRWARCSSRRSSSTGRSSPGRCSVLVATADHRIVDGAHAGQVTTIVRDLLTHPDHLDHPPHHDFFLPMREALGSQGMPSPANLALPLAGHLSRPADAQATGRRALRIGRRQLVDRGEVVGQHGRVAI